MSHVVHSTTTSLGDLHRYTNYSVTVAASTRAGTGLVSDVIVCATDMDGRSIKYNYVHYKWRPKWEVNILRIKSRAMLVYDTIWHVYIHLVWSLLISTNLSLSFSVPLAPSGIKLVVSGPTSVMVSWAPPPRTHGPLVHYTLHYRAPGHPPTTRTLQPKVCDDTLNLQFYLRLIVWKSRFILSSKSRFILALMLITVLRISNSWINLLSI